jgi:hypothetical protein
MSTIIESTAKDLQDIFYGRNPHYRSSTWNSEKRLGDAISSGAGFECGVHAAVYSAALCMIYDFSKAYWAYESEEIGDESDGDYEKKVDHIIAFYGSLFISKKNSPENSLRKIM